MIFIINYYTFFRAFIISDGKIPTKKLKHEELKTLVEVENELSFCGILAEHIILIDVDSEEDFNLLHRILNDMEIYPLITKTSRGGHFYFQKPNYELKKNTKQDTVYCPICLKIDYKPGRNDRYYVDLIKNNGQLREIIQNPDELPPLPFWLQPSKSKNLDYLFGMGEGDGRNQALFNLILSLQREQYNKHHIRTIIKIINKYIFSESLPDKELNSIIRDESFNVSIMFFDEKNKFQHHLMGKYLIDNYHIINWNGVLCVYDCRGIYMQNFQSQEIERIMCSLIPSIKDSQRSEVIKYLRINAPKIVQDPHAYKICFNNCIYNIKSKEVEPFSHENYIKNRIPHNYNASAVFPLLDTVLNNMSNDIESIRMNLEELMGWCFFAKQIPSKIVICNGGGNNGKSLYLKLLRELVGNENCSSVTIQQLEEPYNLSSLSGKMVNLGDDIPSTTIKTSDKLKKLATGEVLVARAIYEPPFDLKNYAKMLFSCNEPPRILDNSFGMDRRILIIPFVVDFTKRDDLDLFLDEKLFVEECMEYAVLVALKGLDRLLNQKAFTESAEIKEVTQDYLVQNSPLKSWLKELEEEEVELLNNTTDYVYSMYKQYCEVNNFYPKSKISFMKELLSVKSDWIVKVVKNPTTKKSMKILQLK